MGQTGKGRTTTVDNRASTAAESELSAVKRQLLARLLAGAGAAPTGQIPSVPAGESVRLSFAQERVWLTSQVSGDVPVFNLGAATQLSQQLDPEAVAELFVEVVRRHDSLRTAVQEVAGQPVLRIADTVDVQVPLTEVPADRVEAAVEEVVLRPYRLDQAPLWRLELLRPVSSNGAGAEPAGDVLVFAAHHLIADAESLALVVQELANPHHRPPLPVRYADYAAWQRAERDSGRYASQEAFWREKLADLPPPLELPADRPRPAKADYHGGTVRLMLPATLAHRLRELGRDEDTTIYTVGLAGLMALLARYTGHTDVVVGAQVSGRDRPELKHLAGMFVNLLPVRTSLAGPLTFRELVRRVGNSTTEAFANREVQFEEMVRWLRAGSVGGPPPLVQVACNLPLAAASSPMGQEIPLPISPGGALLDLTMHLVPRAEDTLELQLDYPSAMFDPSTIEQMAANLRRLWEVACEAPDVLLADLDIVDDEQRRTLLYAGAGPTSAAPDHLLDLIAAQVAAAPDRVAAEAGGRRLTYAELSEAVYSWAGYLRHLGAGPGRVVAVCLDRDLELLIATLAAWHAGAAFLPLDPDHPAARSGQLLHEAAAVAVVADGSRVGLLAPVAPDGCAVVPATLSPPAKAQTAGDALPPPQPADAAYLVFTSGSTGTPKGAVVTHAAIANRVCWSVAVQGLGPADRLLAKTRIGFDAAVLEWLAPLACGGTVVFAAPGVERDPAALVTALADSRATVLQGVPSVLRAMLDQPGWERCDALRQVWSAGEPLDASLVQRLRDRVDATVWNTYGPTECAIDVTAYPVPVEATPAAVPIGRPIAGVRAVVLDRDGRLAPRGVAGELYIGGVAVGAGYLARPGLTAERFVPDPFGAPGARLYRTGDRARWRAEGLLEFVGRLDDQIKINGMRVEPAEAQAVLAAHPDVRHACVIGAAAADGHKRLVGYVVADRQLDLTALRDDLLEHVPAVLVPTALMQLPELPRNPNGKVDRAALPVPEVGHQTTYRAPATPNEHVVAEIWAELLGVVRVGVDDDFFALGGHSLMLGQLAARLRDRTGVQVSIGDLFAELTVRRHAALLGAGSPAPEVRPAHREGLLPLSSGQRRLWFLDRLHPGSPEYLTPLFRRLSGPVDRQHVQRALDELVSRHEVLRTTYTVVGGVPAQAVSPPAPVPLRVLTGDVDPAEIFAEELRHGVDLRSGVVLRATLAEVDDGAILLVVIHHIACDGWSTGILGREFDALYAAYREETKPQLPQPVLQYGDFAAWQEGWLASETVTRGRQYWRTALQDLPTLDLPTDRVRPALRDPRGSVVPFQIPAELAHAVAAAGQAHGASLSMTLLAVFALLLSRYSGQRDIPIGVPVAGRPRPELDHVVGLFINTVVVRGDLSGDPTLAELLARVRQRAVSAFRHADVPFDQVVDDLQPARDLSRNPLYDVLFDLHEEGFSGYLPVAEFGGVSAGSRQDLALIVQRRPDGSLAGMLEYATALFDHSSVERMAAHYRMLLTQFAATPSARVSGVALLTSSERDQLRQAWDAAEAPVTDDTLADLLQQQAMRTPSQPAVVLAGRSLTYGQLHTEADRLARRLVSLGAGPEQVVAVAMPRAIELVIALVAVVRAGAAYLPIDPEQPPARTASVLTDATPLVVVSTAAGTAALPAQSPIPVLVWDDHEMAAVGHAAVQPVPVQPANPAYVIYTSGSTGRPKGVVVTHDAIVNRLRWMQHRYGLGADDRVLHKTPVSFDVSVWELFWPLITGATLVLAEPGGHRDPGYLARLIRDEQITTIHFVPSMLDAFLTEPAHTSATGLRRVICSGEALTPALRDRFHRAFDAELHNLYGPTEAAVDVTAWQCQPGQDTVPIGHPVWNTRIYVLDDDQQHLPPGITGELYLAGVQLARGYLGRPDLTAERFVPDPFGAPGARMYRTGDVARLRPDGAVEYLGRTDDQLKIRGHRVEPGEVAAAVTAHPGVREAVVLAHHSEQETQLVAYWCPASDPPTVAELSEHCHQRLPEAMVPRHFVVMDHLPLTTNGKLDRAALPAPEPTADLGVEVVAPRTVAEQRISAIWAELLGYPVGVHHHFFRVGGHSLLAVRLAARITEEFDVDLPLRLFFEQPTIAGQAEAIEAAIRAEIEQLTDDEVAHLADQGRP